MTKISIVLLSSLESCRSQNDFGSYWQYLTEHSRAFNIFQVNCHRFTIPVYIDFTEELQPSIRRQIGLSSCWRLAKHYLRPKRAVRAVWPERTCVEWVFYERCLLVRFLL